MSDSDPSDAAPAGRLRSLFSFRKKQADSVMATGRDGEASDAPQAMRLRLAEFETRSVDDVMIPRAEIKAVEVGISHQELLEYFTEVTHSRLPVFRQTLDDPIGFVHIRDLVAEIAKGEPPARHPLEKLHREVLYVPPSMKLADLLVKMQATHIHLALVVDEYGGTDGLVTLEDLVEVIVGDIEDEHDEEEATFVQRGPLVWEADARTEIDDFTDECGVDLSLDDLEMDIDTLGGVAFALAGKVPVRGEILRHPGGTEIEILDADSRRVRRMRLRLPEPSQPEAAEE